MSRRHSPVKKKRKKVKFSAGGSEVNRECLIHVLDASKNDVVNKFSTNSWKVGSRFNFAVNFSYMACRIIGARILGKSLRSRLYTNFNVD